MDLRETWVIWICNVHLTNQNESFKYKCVQVNINPLCTWGSNSWRKLSIPNDIVTSEKMEKEVLYELKV